MSRVWVTIMQDNEGNLLALDKDGETILKSPRTRPTSSKDRVPTGAKFGEELVSDVHQMSRLAIVLQLKKDSEQARF